MACVFEPEPLLCVDCGPRVTDPLALRGTPFSAGALIGRGLQLFGREAPRVLGLLAVFSVLNGWVLLAVAWAGAEGSWAFQATLASRVYEFVVGVVQLQAVTALYLAHVDGRRLSVAAALREAVAVWPGTVSASIREALSVFLWLLVFVVPGIRRSVVLQFSRLAALRERDQDPLEVSERVASAALGPSFGVWLLATGFQAAAWVAPEVVGSIMVRLGVDEPLVTWPVIGFVGQVLYGGLQLAFLVVGFVLLHHEAKVPLRPTTWGTRPGLRAVDESRRTERVMP